MTRCEWAANACQLEKDYHDSEWGRPIHDDRLLFEHLILGGAQAGLSWATILKKREGYRHAFDDFDARKIVSYSDKKIEKLLQNPEIIRNRLKVKSTITNARQFLAVQDEFGSFDAYIWSFVDGNPIKNQWEVMSEVPVSTTESDVMSKDMKKLGFKFIGTTICYAFMQAVGMVNDHTTDCSCYASVHRLS